ncbi:MAG: hypothetical protein LUD18_13375 [Lachnospiraceae bacterium]|nr:hypothetical protein [Lachnospiraceae bacterium]
MNKGMKKAAVYFLSASLAATSLAGCSKDTSSAFDADATVMTINEEEVSAGVVKFAVHYSQAQMQEIYEYYFGDNPFSYEYSTGYTIGDMMIESCVDTFYQLILARQHMEEYEVELTEDEEAAITEAAAAFIEANDEETLEVISATQEIVEEYLTLITIQTKMEVAMVADVDTEVSDEEAAQRRVEYVYVETEDEDETEEETEEAESESEEESAEETEEETAADTEEETAVDSESETALLTGNTAVKTTSADETESETETADAVDEESDAEDASEAEADTEEETDTEEESETETETETEDPETAAAMAAAYEKAEQIIALVQDGMDLEEAAAEIDEDLSVTETTFGADSTSVVEDMITATEDLADDTLVDYPVEGTSGYYVVRVISAFDEEATEEEKESIVEERKEDAIDALYEEWEEDSEITTDDDVLATITIDINLSLYEEEETEDETEAESEAESETDTEEESETEIETESETASEEESEPETEAEETEMETESETESEADAETESETESESED